MSYLIRCYTLFDISATGIRQRTCPVNLDTITWTLKRNQQCNFDTVIQTISIRSLPEIISEPVVIKLKRHKFGSRFKKTVTAWTFEFEISDIAIWLHDNNSLYYLHQDCDDVPMILCGTEVSNLDRALSVNCENANIYFEVINENT